MAPSARTEAFIFTSLNEYTSLVAGNHSTDNHIFIVPTQETSIGSNTWAKSKPHNSIDTLQGFLRASQCAKFKSKTQLRNKQNLVQSLI